MKRIFVIFLASLLLASCASVPKESVELSATVGRDLSEMHRAHRELAIIYYDRIADDINTFVDDVYAPFQIKKTLVEFDSLIIGAIEDARDSDAGGENQKHGFAVLNIFLEELRNEIESYRQSKLNPILDQRQQLLQRIDEAYGRIHYANSIVTGHLASVVKVHDAQNDILAKMKMSDLQKKISVQTTDFSDNLKKLLKNARSGNEQADSLIKKFNALQEKKNKK